MQELRIGWTTLANASEGLNSESKFGRNVRYSYFNKIL